MIEYILAGIAAIVSAVAIYRLISVYLEVRSTSNRLLAVAQKQFAHSVERILKTEEELPPVILALIRMMGETAFMPGAERILIKEISKSAGSRRDSGMVAAMDGLRPELRQLFGEATTAWLNIMTHKSTLGGFRISLAMSKVEAAAGKIPVIPAKTALPAMREMATANFEPSARAA